MTDKADTSEPFFLYLLLGFNRAGRFMWLTIFVLAIPVLTLWTVLLPKWRFSAADEHLFKAARHKSSMSFTTVLSGNACLSSFG